MTTLIKILVLVGLISSPVFADNLPTLEVSPSNKTASSEPDKDSICTRCHDETESKPILALYQTPHGNRADTRTPFCQSCHGESQKHLSGAGVDGIRPPPDVVFGSKTSTTGIHEPNDPATQNAACLSCHGTDPQRTHWQGGIHQVNGVACTSCHVTHAAHDKVRDKITQPDVCFTCHKDQRADSRKFSHHPIIEGKAVCSDCHNPHGSAGPKLLVKNTVNETCFVCHAEKRGPMLWEHQPVTEDCTNCHTPHGSNITPLLTSRPPFLCDECHDGPHTSDRPVAGNAAGFQGGFTGANPSTSFTGRACLNCHSMVHGSNDPAGALLHR